MVTQLQPTPILYGDDAKKVIAQVNKKPTREQKERAEQRRQFFAQIKKQGL